MASQLVQACGSVRGISVIENRDWEERGVVWGFWRHKDALVELAGLVKEAHVGCEF